MNLRIDFDLKAVAEKAAAQDQRSLMSTADGTLSDHLEATGYLA